MEKYYRFGWYAFLIAMTGDILVSMILPFFYGGYSILKMSISALGNPQSPVRLPFNIWMFVEGLLFLAAIPAVYKLYHEVSGGITYTLIVFISVFAIGACIFTCFFSVNVSKDIVTTASQIHGAGSAIGFMLFLAVPILLAILEFRTGHSGTGAACIICFILAMTFFVLFVMSDKPAFSDTIISNEGLWERLNLVFMNVPLVLISIRQIIGGIGH